MDIRLLSYSLLASLYDNPEFTLYERGYVVALLLDYAVIQKRILSVYSFISFNTCK
jgi:hypothetical protein